MQYRTKDRTKLITKLLAVCKELRDLNNYNTMMGIIAGLNMSSVSRLKQTFAGLKRATTDMIKQYQLLLDPAASFKTLRSSIKASGGNILPYIGVSLSDITFMDDGNPDMVTTEDGESYPNMEKYQLLTTAISNVKQYQTAAYRIAPVPTLYGYLVELPCLTESMLYNLSLEREPRDPNGTLRGSSR